MSKDYNFEPDYAAWWEKEDLTKEQIILLIFGISPDDNEKNIALSASENNTEEEYKWQREFRWYCDSLDPFLAYNLNNYRKLLSGKNKQDIVQNAYENYLQIHADFLAFLVEIKAVVQRPDLEMYKDHSRFEANNSKVEPVINENYALAKILGVEEVHFNRFIELDEICKDEPPDENNFVAYVRFAPNEKWFYSEYGKYLGEHFSTENYKIKHHNIMPLLHKIKSYNLWEGDFNKYCQDVHDAGFIFGEKTYESLRQQGIHLKYSKDGWAYKFYSDWLKRKPLWTIEIAGKLYTGADPDSNREFWGTGEFKKGQSGFGLNDFKTVFFYDENGEWIEPTNGNFLDEISLERFIRQHVAKGTLIAKNQDEKGNFEFEPIDIIKFFKEYCPNTVEPLALFDVLDITYEGDTNHVTHSGTAGRPNARSLYTNELRTRASNQNLAPTVKAQAEALKDWLNQQNLAIATPTIKGIENAIRHEYKALKAKA